MSGLAMVVAALRSGISVVRMLMILRNYFCCWPSRGRGREFPSPSDDRNIDAADAWVAIAGAQQRGQAGRGRKYPRRSTQRRKYGGTPLKISSSPFGNGLMCLMVRPETASPRPRARSTASLIGPGLNPSRRAEFVLRPGRGSSISETHARSLRNLLRRLAVISRCNFGEPVGWPSSSCSSPVATGYLPLKIFVPGATCCVMPSGLDKLVRLVVDHRGEIRGDVLADFRGSALQTPQCASRCPGQSK